MEKAYLPVVVTFSNRYRLKQTNLPLVESVKAMPVNKEIFLMLLCSSFLLQKKQSALKHTLLLFQKIILNNHVTHQVKNQHYRKYETLFPLSTVHGSLEDTGNHDPSSK